MATGTANTRSAPPTPPLSGQSLANRRFIERQLQRTSLHVKLVDLFGGLMILATSLLGFLLVTAIIDAWILDLGSWGRLLALALLVICGIVYFAMYATPVLVRRVNPQFAARMIEECEPTLKNSIINFLTFQSNRTAVQEVVYDALEQRAAIDLSHIPVESTVDRSKLIRVGYLLAGVMVVCGLYKVLSPKDPFQTFARIMNPFAQISRPARVEISNVSPGSTEVFRGEQVQVTVTVDSVLEEGDVKLLYTTEDGQTVDAEIAMKRAGHDYIFECQLPETGSGIQQTTLYRIQADDAVSEEYRVKVLAAPTIVVERLVYDYPDYTGRPSLVAERQGDVRALEGTRVAVHARSNHPIQSARIELIPSASSRRGDRPRMIPMRVDESADSLLAQGEFVLSLQADRRTPLYSNYRVHMLTDDGHRNEQPNDHQIEVVPDLAPEIEILLPRRDLIEVPEGGTATIEIRGIDPDYGLTRLGLRGIAGGEAVLKETLMLDAKGRLGQTVVSYEFKPRELDLKAGDQVEYWAIAADNRTSPGDGSPDPNETRTRPSYFLKIVAADESADSLPPPSGDDKRPSSRRRPRGDKGEAGSADDSPPDRPEPRDPSADGAAEKRAGDVDKSGASKSKGSGDSPRGSDAGGSKKGSGDATGSETGESGETSKSGGSKSGDSGEDGGASSEDRGSESGSRETSESGESRSESSDGREKSSEEPHPGEVFEKILKHLDEKKGESSGDKGSEKSEGTESGSSSSGSGQQGETTSGGGESEGSKDAGSKDTEEKERPGGETAGGDKKESGGEKAEETKTGSSSESEGDKADSGGASGGQKESGTDRAKGGAQSGSQGGESGAGQKQGGSESASDSQGAGGGKKQGAQPNAGSQSGSSGGGTQGGQKAESQSGGSQSPGGDAGKDQTGQSGQAGQSGGDDNGGGQQPKEGQQGGGASGSPMQQQKGGQPMGGGGESSGNQSSGGKKPSGGEGSSGGSQGGSKSQQKSGGGGQQGGGSQGGQQQKQGQGGQQAQKSGSSAAGGGKPKQGGQKSGGQGKQGKPGGGSKSEDKNGAPGGQQSNQDNEKKQKKSPGPGSKKKGGGAKSPGTSKSKSGSASESEGDRSGAGGAGGGQNSGQSGNDSDGGTNPSDEGAGTADESGQGDTSERAGDDQTAGRKTGQSGTEAGEGSKTRKSDTGDKPTERPGSRVGDKEGSPIGGGGGMGNTIDGPDRSDSEITAGDDPNLEYARKATDLALEYLRDQKESPDRELLDKLDLTKDELRAFVERWESMKRKGGKGDTSERRHLDESLRSLGLRPDRDKRRAGGASKDIKSSGDSGRGNEPPPKFLEGFNAFIKGTARSKKD